MSPESNNLPTRKNSFAAGTVLSEATRLDEIATRLMVVQREWNECDRAARLADVLAASRQVWYDIQTALAEATLPLPPAVQHNLLILSVYADSKMDACKAAPGAETLGGLIALTHSLAGSLREWREAA